MADRYCDKIPGARGCVLPPGHFGACCTTFSADPEAQRAAATRFPVVSVGRPSCPHGVDVHIGEICSTCDDGRAYERGRADAEREIADWLQSYPAESIRAARAARLVREGKYRDGSER